MRKKEKEEMLGKTALLWALACAVDMNRGMGTEFWYPEEKDWVRFQFDGHKCKLLSVDKVDYDNGYITMCVLAKGVELSEWTPVTVNFLHTHFRYDTLRKIVVEFYMCSNACNNDTWADDVDGFIRDRCADWFDSYDSFMGYR